MELAFPMDLEAQNLHQEKRNLEVPEADEQDNESEEWDAWEGLKARPERFAPLGANDSDKETPACGPFDDSCNDPVEVFKMKEEQEQLTAALLALTTHFAQVQFRVQQIVEAPQEEREYLLKDLEEFAFRGIPSAVTQRLATDDVSPDDDISEKMRLQSEKLKRQIGQFKTQLEELESYAYSTGEAGLPQSVLLERHKMVVEQLSDKLHLNVEDLEKLSEEDLKTHVEQAISDLVNPMKVKEEMVEQLKTQISDLERFIQYLHAEGTWDGSCSCPFASKSAKGCKKSAGVTSESYDGTASGHTLTNNHEEELRAKSAQLMRKALTLIQMFAASQFGCSANHFHMNTLKKSAKGNHWGDLRAQLEVAINKVYRLGVQSQVPNDSDYTSDGEDVPSISSSTGNHALTSAVRKDLAVALANLFEHGLMLVSYADNVHKALKSQAEAHYLVVESSKGKSLFFLAQQMGQTQSIVPFLSCFPSRSAAGSGFITVWDLIMRYYQLKNGEKYNATPARRLSQSFGLEIVGSKAITNRELLLSTIDNIITTHSRYKRSPESHFKAFVCAALNQKKLVHWLRLIVRCQGLIEQCYQPWSYVMKTGCEDSFRSLDRLTSLNFELPIDLAIRQFQNIKDAFQ